MDAHEAAEAGELFSEEKLFQDVASFAVRFGQAAETPDVARSWTFTLADIPALVMDSTAWRVIYTSSLDVEEGVEGDSVELESNDGVLIKSVLLFRDRETGEIISGITYAGVGERQEWSLPEIPQDPEERQAALDRLLAEKAQDPEAMQRFEESLRFDLAGGSDPSPDDYRSIAKLARSLKDWFNK